MSDTVFHLGNAAKNIIGTPEYQPFSGVRIIVGEDSSGNQLVYEAGNSSGRMIEIENPYGTQAMANSILSKLRGYQYKPYTADGAIINPAAELGDGISVGDVYSFIASAETTISPIMSATVAAYEDGELDHEYPYESPDDKEIIRKINGVETGLIVKLGEVRAWVSDSYYTKDESDVKFAEISIKADNILLTVSEIYETIIGSNGKLEDAKGYTREYADAVGLSVSQSLSAQISLTATQIKSTVAAATTKYYLGNVSPSLFGYGSPEEMGEGYEANQHAGEIYLDQDTGYYYTSNGSTWVKSANPLQRIDNRLESNISQTAASITSTVASAVSKFDLSVLGTTGYPWSSGATFQNFGYGIPDNSTAVGKNNQYYLDQAGGIYYKSNNKSWVKQNSTPLPLITQSLSSKIDQTASSIALQVSGANAPEWQVGASYRKDEVVKVTTTNTDGIVVATTFYKAIDAHEADENNKPPNNEYWEVADAPTVQSLIDINLDGITLGTSGSDKDNSAYIRIYKDGVIIDGTTITMSNVVADTIKANTSMITPKLFNANENTYLTMVGDRGYVGAGMSVKAITYDDNDEPSEQTIFSVQNNGFGGVSLVGMGDLFLLVQSGLGSDPDITAYGNWDFSRANVTGL